MGWSVALFWKIITPFRYFCSGGVGGGLARYGGLWRRGDAITQNDNAMSVFFLR